MSDYSARGNYAWKFVAFAVIGRCFMATSAQSAERVDFSRDVLPILSANCFPCHGPDDQARQGNLRLDTREGALRAEQPVIQPGKGNLSELVLRVSSQDPEQRMPPANSNRQLSPQNVELLRRWVDEGALWGGHWAFEAVRRPPVPTMEDESWSRNPVDRFILARWKQTGLQPAPEADKATLFRRAKLDLVGLPPTVEESAAFLADDRPDAYERVVDRLLASPHYGERWGRHWLDAARYADSTGFETDAPRSLWSYRDWVIGALNNDLPFDEFTVQQLAGDLLPGASIAERIATGFLLCGPQDGGSEPSRLDAVVERTNTLGTVFLGLTLGCAQCHSHKFDPLSQQEYYRLFAFLNAADEAVLELAPAEQVARRDALRAQLAALVAEREMYTAKLAAGTAATDPGHLERSRTIDALKSQIPDLASAPMLIAPPAPRPTTLFIRGEYSKPGELVTPGVPAVLPPLPAEQTTRLGLARWLVSSEQPLTPRVTVNRIWQQHFGRGLVETENDFGVQGARPSHPELLDWLAADFVSRGWRLKTHHRLIVSSAAYRQSSHRPANVETLDPENRLLARQSRLRLEGEVIRDAALAASDLLSTKIGGPSVFPFQHEGVMLNRATPAPWIMSPGADRYRRGLYTHYWRLTPHPFLQTFDAPDSLTACTRRRASNTPLQALTLLNDPTFAASAQALARRVLREALPEDSERLNLAFQLCLGRLPTSEEHAQLMELLAVPRTSRATTGSTVETLDQTAWTQICRVLLNLDEFVTRE